MHAPHYFLQSCADIVSWNHKTAQLCFAACYCYACCCRLGFWCWLPSSHENNIFIVHSMIVAASACHISYATHTTRYSKKLQRERVRLVSSTWARWRIRSDHVITSDGRVVRGKKYMEIRILMMESFLMACDMERVMTLELSSLHRRVPTRSVPWLWYLYLWTVQVRTCLCLHVCMYVSMYLCIYLPVCLYANVIYLFLYACVCLSPETKRQRNFSLDVVMKENGRMANTTVEVSTWVVMERLIRGISRRACTTERAHFVAKRGHVYREWVWKAGGKMSIKHHDGSVEGMTMEGDITDQVRDHIILVNLCFVTSLHFNQLLITFLQASSFSTEWVYTKGTGPEVKCGRAAALTRMEASTSGVSEMGSLMVKASVCM